MDKVLLTYFLMFCWPCISM